MSQNQTNSTALSSFFLLAVCFLFISCQQEKEYQSTEELLSAMKAKNDKSWYRHFTFKQHTIFFNKEGEKTDSTVWHEAVSYPYLFRIDRELEQNNYTIYRNDSTYQFKQDSLFKATDAPAVHLVFKGGLYFISLEEALQKLTQYGFQTDVFRKGTFMSEPVYVIGEKDKQFWLHADHFYCMRRISTNKDGKITDVIYDDFKPLGKGWVEQKVTFFFDGKKRLEEFYFDIEEREYINPFTYAIDENFKWYLNK